MAEPRGRFPGIAAGFAEGFARSILARATDAVYNHEADGIVVDCSEVATLCVAVLSVGESARPANVDENDPHRGADWEYCRECDGCGWSEGGSALKTHCESCGGTGVIVSIAQTETGR